MSLVDDDDVVVAMRYLLMAMSQRMMSCFDGVDGEGSLMSVGSMGCDVMMTLIG